jgi:serine/threonine protein kinase
MIFLEKCTGTLDQLFVKKRLDLDGIASCLFQVIMILIAYQKTFHFTHNDLHTNNIMYVETDVEFLYYKHAGKYYKVPTYGKIFKIIDFGRAIYKLQGKTFCSDSFGPGGDASTQYNFEPFFNKKKARIDPNYSFDLCRLGCSIYDFILDINEEMDDAFTHDAFQSLIIHWVKDDNGKNVIYKKSGEERYPNFKLYKMIARTVHNKTPESQLENPFFQPFHLEAVEAASVVIDVDSLPCYA